MTRETDRESAQGYMREASVRYLQNHPHHLSDTSPSSHQHSIQPRNHQDYQLSTSSLSSLTIRLPSKMRQGLLTILLLAALPAILAVPPKKGEPSKLSKVENTDSISTASSDSQREREVRRLAAADRERLAQLQAQQTASTPQPPSRASTAPVAAPAPPAGNGNGNGNRPVLPPIDTSNLVPQSNSPSTGTRPRPSPETRGPPLNPAVTPTSPSPLRRSSTQTSDPNKPKMRSTAELIGYGGVARARASSITDSAAQKLSPVREASNRVGGAFKSGASTVTSGASTVAAGAGRVGSAVSGSLSQAAGKLKIGGPSPTSPEGKGKGRAPDEPAFSVTRRGGGQQPIRGAPPAGPAAAPAPALMLGNPDGRILRPVNTPAEPLSSSSSSSPSTSSGEEAPPARAPPRWRRV